MPNQNYLEELAENIDDRTIGLDHIFKFKCQSCGKCCKNRDDILLASRDLFNIARKFEMKPMEVVSKYCELYIGEDSRIPIIRLRPVGQNKRCPFLQNKRCIVHDTKPSVCALFPLGRFVIFENETTEAINAGDLNIKYLINPIECGGHRNNTVQSWLETFGVDPEDRFHKLWTITIMRLGNHIRKLESAEKKISEIALNAIWNVAVSLLYAKYETEKDYLPQFEANLAELWHTIEKIDTEIIQLVNGEN